MIAFYSDLCMLVSEIMERIVVRVPQLCHRWGSGSGDLLHVSGRRILADAKRVSLHGDLDLGDQNSWTKIVVSLAWAANSSTKRLLEENRGNL